MVEPPQSENCHHARCFVFLMLCYKSTTTALMIGYTKVLGHFYMLRNRKQRLELKLLTILETKNGLLLYFLKPN